MKRPSQHDVTINLTGMREEVVRQFFDAIRPLVRAFDDIDAADRILRGTTADIAATAEVHSNGNGRNGAAPKSRKINRKMSKPGTKNAIVESIRQFIPSATGELRARDLLAALPNDLRQAHQSTFFAALKTLVQAGDLRKDDIGTYSRGSGSKGSGSKNGNTPTLRTPSSSFVLDVLAAAYPKGLTNREVSEALVMKGVELKKDSRHSHLVQTGWHLNVLRDGGKIRIKGAGPTRLCFAIPPKVTVTKEE